MIINVTSFAPLLRPAGVFLCGLLVSVCLVACMAESLGRVPAEDPIPVTLRVGTARAVPGANADGTVHNIYLLAFNRKEGGKRSYGVHLADLNANPFTLPGILTGQYDFCIVANPSAALVGALDGVSSRKAMEALSVLRNELAPAVDRYVMCGIQEDVLLDTDGLGNGLVTYTDASGTLHTQVGLLNMLLQRLVSRVHVTVTLVPAGQVDNVRLTGLPASVPLLPLPDLQAVKGPDIPLRLNAGASTAERFVYEQEVIPSYLFTPVDNRGEAALLEADINGDGKRAVLRHAPAMAADGTQDITTDYTLHRNTEYTITADATTRLDLTVAVRDWDEQLTDTPVGTRPLDKEVYLSSVSPLYLRRSGYLHMNDADVGDYVLRIADDPGKWVEVEYDAMALDWRLTQVGGVSQPRLANAALQTEESWQAYARWPVDTDKQVTLVLQRGGAVLSSTVYLNRVRLKGLVWIDRELGAEKPDGKGMIFAMGARFPYKEDGTAMPGQSATAPAKGLWNEGPPCPPGYIVADWDDFDKLLNQGVARPGLAVNDLNYSLPAPNAHAVECVTTVTEQSTGASLKLVIYDWYHTGGTKFPSAGNDSGCYYLERRNYNTMGFGRTVTGTGGYENGFFAIHMCRTRCIRK